MKKLFLCCTLLILSPLFLAAQGAGRGALSGLVTDTSGAVVPDASVQLTDTDTGVVQQTRSSGAGLYSFISLIPGTYSLQVSKTGFKTSMQQNISITVNVTASVNMTLSLGAVTETVTVSTAPPVLDVSPNATTGQLISEEQLKTVPLVTRDVFELTQLAPGINATNGDVNSLDTGQSGERNQTGEYVRANAS